MRPTKKATFLAFLLLGSAGTLASLSKDELIDTAKSRCIVSATTTFGVEATEVEVVRNKAPKYKLGLKGAFLVLDIGSRVGKRTCIVKKNGDVVFSRNISIR